MKAWQEVFWEKINSALNPLILFRVALYGTLTRKLNEMGFVWGNREEEEGYFLPKTFRPKKLPWLFRSFEAMQFFFTLKLCNVM